MPKACYTLTPTPLTAIGPGPWIENHWLSGGIHIAVQSGTGVTAIIEGSNDQTCPAQLSQAQQSPLDAGAGDTVRDDSGLRYLRLNVLTGPAFSVTASKNVP